ncbi:MAG: aspartate kinase [Planctomyces sp.]|nr:aspartate kinase [Planctomyces sp.]MBA4040078.1 aspartate kinase [Planctomyces sp.]
MSVVVQKFGGTSVADAEKFRASARHVLAARALGHRVVVVVSAMGHETDRLVDLAHTVTPSPDRREMDQLLATGEQVSVAMMALTLQTLGCAARSLTGQQAGIVTDAAHQRATVVSMDPTALRGLLEGGVVPVVAGFQGVERGGDVTTLGRGGSDTTAVAVAARLKDVYGSATCEIYKDVDGVYTADPRVVPGARRLEAVTYDEMLEAAALGSQVIHPRAVEMAKRFGVPVRVLHSQEAAGRVDAGTLLVGETEPAMETRVVSSVVVKRNVARVSLRGLPNRAGVQSAVFGPVAQARLPVDDIIQEDDGPGTINLTFTLDRGDVGEVRAIAQRAGAEYGAQAVRIDTGLSTVSIVGEGMRHATGVAARMFRALAEEGVPIENITTSEIRVSIVVAEGDAERAARCLHGAFELGTIGALANSPQGLSD